MAGKPPRPLAMVSANQAWNLVHFRGDIIRALLADGYRVMAVAPDDGRWSAELRAMGCEFVHLPLDPAGARPLRELATIAALIRLLRRTRPAIWFSWTIKPNIYGALAARLTGVPAFPNVSGLGTLFIRQSPLTTVARSLYRVAFRRCPAVFFQNADDRDLFVERGMVRADQCRLLPGSGIDLERFHPPAAPPPARRRFLMIARLLADKGVREFVAAARIVRQHWPDARFTLLGPVDVANRTAISAQEVQDWVSEGVIEWHPATADIRPAMAAADWVVLPSYREGMPRVLLEALAMGRPIVTTDVPGCRETVEVGANGFLARHADATSLATALGQAAGVDPARWAEMSAHSRTMAERRFSVAHVVAAYRSVFALSRINCLAPQIVS